MNWIVLVFAIFLVGCAGQFSDRPRSPKHFLHGGQDKRLQGPQKATLVRGQTASDRGLPFHEGNDSGCSPMPVSLQADSEGMIPQILNCHSNKIGRQHKEYSRAGGQLQSQDIVDAEFASAQDASSSQIYERVRATILHSSDPEHTKLALIHALDRLHGFDPREGSVVPEERRPHPIQRSDSLASTNIDQLNRSGRLRGTSQKSSPEAMQHEIRPNESAVIVCWPSWFPNWMLNAKEREQRNKPPCGP